MEQPQMVYCPEGHVLTPMTETHLRAINDEYDGGYHCDACMSSRAQLYHCDLCSFDLCRACGVAAAEKSCCVQNHQLLRFTAEDIAAANISKPSRPCTKCKASDPFQFMMVCPGCEYYLCPKCYREIVSRIHQTQKTHKHSTHTHALVCG